MERHGRNRDVDGVVGQGQRVDRRGHQADVLEHAVFAVEAVHRPLDVEPVVGPHVGGHLAGVEARPAAEVDDAVLVRADHRDQLLARTVPEPADVLEPAGVRHVEGVGHGPALPGADLTPVCRRRPESVGESAID